MLLLFLLFLVVLVLVRRHLASPTATIMCLPWSESARARPRLEYFNRALATDHRRNLNKSWASGDNFTSGRPAATALLASTIFPPMGCKGAQRRNVVVRFSLAFPYGTHAVRRQEIWRQHISCSIDAAFNAAMRDVMVGGCGWFVRNELFAVG